MTTGFTHRFKGKVAAAQLVMSAAEGLAAHAGGGQANALPLSKTLNRITTVANAADSVRLSAAAPGLQLTVVNAHASNAIAVFPASGDQINALGANAAFSLAATKCAIFIATVAGQWHSILSA